MKGKKRLVSLILAFVLIFCSLSITTFAGEKSAQGNGVGGRPGGGTGTMKVVNGPSFKKTGYVIYIVSGDGSIVKEPKAFTTYGTSPTGAWYLDTRFGNRHVTSVDTSFSGQWWGYAPFDDKGYGKGGEIKDWLIQGTVDGGFNMLLLIQSMWDFSTAQQFVLKDQYLIVEPFLWCELYNGNAPKGNVVATSLGWVHVREDFGYNRSGLETRYTLGILPNSCCFSMSWLSQTPPSDISSKHDLGEIKASAYGVVACKASELFDAPPEPDPTPASTGDYLTANELNFSFPDFKTDTDDMRAADTYEKFYNMGKKAVWNKHTDGDGFDDDGKKYTFKESKVSGGVWYIEETITSSIKAKIGLKNALLYRSEAGRYFASTNAENLKTISCGEGGNEGDTDKHYPGYGFDLTRTTFGDNLVLSEFTSRGNNQDLVDGKKLVNWFKDELKFAVGHDGVKSTIKMTENVEGQTADKKEDTHTFKAKITEAYKRQPWTYDSATDTWTAPAAGTAFEDATKEYTQSDIEYKTSHGLFKYTPYDIKTVKNTQAGNRIADPPTGGAYPKVAWASQMTGTLKMYPEVKYKGYYMTGNGVWSSPAEKVIYAMGEKQRSCYPGIIHGYNTYLNGSIKGNTFVDSPLTGTNADYLKDTWEKKLPDTKGYEVSAQGSGFETKVYNLPVIKFVSFGLDLNEKAINGFTPRTSWEHGDTESSHSGFVNSVVSNLDMEVILRRYNLAGAKQGEDYKMSFDVSKVKIGATETDQIPILFENGALRGSDRTTIINRIASEYGISVADATSAWNNSGIEKQLETMLETKLSDKNNSGKNLPSGVKYKTSEKWYDETSECFAIRIATTYVTFGDILLSDKNDYGSSSNQSDKNITTVGKDGYICRYYYSLLHLGDSVSADGFTLPLPSNRYLIKETEVDGARFIVSNATTNNMRR